MGDRLTITLHDEAARQVLHSIARSYAILCIKSRLDGGKMWNAPWPRHSKFGDWMRDIDRERMAYKRTLLSIFPELPEIEQPEWRMIEAPKSEWRMIKAPKSWAGTKWVGSGVFYPSYSPTEVARVADEYAAAIARIRKAEGT